MKKKFIALLLVVTILLPYPILISASTRTFCVNPTLTFGVDTVFCDVVITADPGDSIVAKITLYEGNVRIRTWNRTNTEYLIFSQYVPAQNGYKYTLTVDATVDGTKEPTVSVEATYVQ